MASCRLAGHRLRFSSDGPTMRWSCERCGGEAGEKTYGTVEEASRYARAFDREDRRDAGKRAPLGMLPLRLLRAVRQHRGED